MRDISGEKYSTSCSRVHKFSQLILLYQSMHFDKINVLHGQCYHLLVFLFFINVFHASINPDLTESLTSSEQVSKTGLFKLIFLIIQTVRIDALLKISGLILQNYLLSPFSYSVHCVGFALYSLPLLLWS